MAYDFYLKLEGIDGEATDSKHDKWIEILSFSTGITQAGSSRSVGGQSTTGKADAQDFVVVKTLDKSSPKLAKFCACGEHIKSATIDCCQSTKEKHIYMQYKLTDVVISSVRPNGSTSQETLPLEEVSMRYAKIEWQYTPIDKAGKAQAAEKANWDIKLNTVG